MDRSPKIEVPILIGISLDRGAKKRAAFLAPLLSLSLPIPSLANLLGRVTALEWPWTARIKFVFGRAPAKLDRTEINPRLSVRREERVAAAAALN